MSQKRAADIARAYSNGYNAAFNTRVVSIEELKQMTLQDIVNMLADIWLEKNKDSYIGVVLLLVYQYPIFPLPNKIKENKWISLYAVLEWMTWATGHKSLKNQQKMEAKESRSLFLNANTMQRG